jgi:hypothetical protein
MDNAIDKYSDQRLQAGLFYVILDMHDFTFTSQSFVWRQPTMNYLQISGENKILELKMIQENHKKCTSYVSVEEFDLYGRNFTSTGRQARSALILRYFRNFTSTLSPGVEIVWQ